NAKEENKVFSHEKDPSIKSSPKHSEKVDQHETDSASNYDENITEGDRKLLGNEDSDFKSSEQKSQSERMKESEDHAIDEKSDQEKEMKRDQDFLQRRSY
ncbi:hypothetical protein TNCT_624881, partial [Trichonephila clavata]